MQIQIYFALHIGRIHILQIEKCKWESLLNTNSKITCIFTLHLWEWHLKMLLMFIPQLELVQNSAVQSWAIVFYFDKNIIIFIIWFLVINQFFYWKGLPRASPRGSPRKCSLPEFMKILNFKQSLRIWCKLILQKFVHK